MADEKVIAVHSVEAWTEQLNQAKESNKLEDNFMVIQRAYELPSHGTMPITRHISSVVIDFTATWCGPCRAIAPYFAELAKRFLDVIFLKVDIDELQSVAGDFKVRSVPTFIFMKEAQTVHTIIGGRKAEIEEKILQYA